MKKIKYYLKYIAIFITFELFITFIVSILNLIGLNNGISAIILFIYNIILYFIINYINASRAVKKGYLKGIVLSSILLIIMILIKLIFISTKFTTSTLVYYIILLLIGIIGAMFGVNKKNKE